MNQEPRLICVTGPDGAGKTTQINKLAYRLERDKKKKVAVATIWDLLIDPATKDSVPFKGPKDVDKFLRILQSTSRMLFLHSVFFQAIELAKQRNPEILLINSYWYKYFATEIAHGGDRDKLVSISNIFKEPELVFYMRITPNEAFKRKATLSGYESGFADPKTEEAFVKFQKIALKELDDMAAKYNWINLNGNEPIDILTDMIISKI